MRVGMIVGGARRLAGVWALHAGPAAAAGPARCNALLTLAPASPLFSFSANSHTFVIPARLLSGSSAFQPLAAPATAQPPCPRGDGNDRRQPATGCNSDASTPPAGGGCSDGGGGCGGAAQPCGGDKGKGKGEAKAAQMQEVLQKSKATALKYGTILVQILLKVGRQLLQMARDFVAKVLPLIKEKYPVYKKVIIAKIRDIEYSLLDKACKLKEKRQHQRSEGKGATSQTKSVGKKEDGPHQKQ